MPSAGYCPDEGRRSQEQKRANTIFVSLRQIAYKFMVVRIICAMLSDLS